MARFFIIFGCLAILAAPCAVRADDSYSSEKNLDQKDVVKKKFRDEETKLDMLKLKINDLCANPATEHEVCVAKQNEYQLKKKDFMRRKLHALALPSNHDGNESYPAGATH